MTRPGAVNVLAAWTEGFSNVPKLYGSDVRPRGKVTDLKSGAVEGAKQFYYGMWDGLSGIVTKPMKGAKESGALGATTGAAKGLLD
ncbi:hypothetical protein FRB94_007335, partial [Tulasnella sp. JGI-2019a]